MSDRVHGERPRARLDSQPAQPKRTRSASVGVHSAALRPREKDHPPPRQRFASEDLTRPRVNNVARQLRPLQNAPAPRFAPGPERREHLGPKQEVRDDSALPSERRKKNLVNKRANSMGDMDHEKLRPPLSNGRQMGVGNNPAPPKPGIGDDDLLSSVDPLSDIDDSSDDDEPMINDTLRHDTSTDKPRPPLNPNAIARKKTSVASANEDELEINEQLPTSNLKNTTPNPPSSINLSGKKASIDSADGGELEINEAIRTDDPAKRTLTQSSPNNDPRKKTSLASHNEDEVSGNGSKRPNDVASTGLSPPSPNNGPPKKTSLAGSGGNGGRESLVSQSGVLQSNSSSGQGGGGVTNTNEEQLENEQGNSLLGNPTNNLTTKVKTRSLLLTNELLSGSNDRLRTSSSDFSLPNPAPRLARSGYGAPSDKLEGKHLPGKLAGKVKDIGASSGYLIQGGQKLLKAEITLVQKSELKGKAWLPWEKPDSDKINKQTDFLKVAPIVADVVGDVAAPFKFVEYIGAAAKSGQDIKDVRAAKKIIEEWDRLDDLAHNATSTDARIQAEDKRNALDAKKALAEQTLKAWKTNGDAFLQGSGHVKAWSGLGKYGYSTFLAGKHCVDAAKGTAKKGFWVAFKASVKATKDGAFLMASSIIGLVFNPASMIYYAWQARKDSKKLDKITSMASKIANLPSNLPQQDALFSDVVARVKRKCGKDSFGTWFKRWTNRFRSGIAAIGIVGSAMGVAKAAGATAAIVAGATAVAATWPVIVGIAGATALAAASYGIYKLARHRSSSGHKADLQQTHQLTKMLTAPERTDEDQSKFYGSSKVKRVVQGMAADRTCFTQRQGAQLLQRFADKALTDVDLRNLATWCERENVRSDTSAATHALLHRLVAEGQRGENELGGSDTASFLNRLGLSHETIEALYNSASAALALTDDAARDKALKAPMKLLAKQLVLR